MGRTMYTIQITTRAFVRSCCTCQTCVAPVHVSAGAYAKIQV